MAKTPSNNRRKSHKTHKPHKLSRNPRFKSIVHTKQRTQRRRNNIAITQDDIDINFGNMNLGEPNAILANPIENAIINNDAKELQYIVQSTTPNQSIIYYLCELFKREQNPYWIYNYIQNILNHGQSISFMDFNIIVNFNIFDNNIIIPLINNMTPSQIPEAIKMLLIMINRDIKDNDLKKQLLYEYIIEFNLDNKFASKIPIPEIKSIIHMANNKQLNLMNMLNKSMLKHNSEYLDFDTIDEISKY